VHNDLQINGVATASSAIYTDMETLDNITLTHTHTHIGAILKVSFVDYSAFNLDSILIYKAHYFF
jgi:hypothetical protein